MTSQIRTIPFYIFGLALTLLLPVRSMAQQSIGSIVGKVLMESPEQAQQLAIKVEEVTTEATIETASVDTAGNFTVRNLPFATYDLYLLRSGQSVAVRRVIVSSAVPVYIALDTVPSYQGHEVTITDSHIETTRTTVHSLYTAPIIRTLPTTNPQQAMEAVLLNSPGVVPDEDGRLHMRGEDANIQYVIDGIPVTMNQTRIYTPLFDASIIEAADLLRGSLNPEYGVATSGVMNISTKSGFDGDGFAHAAYALGSFGNTYKTADFGGHAADMFAYYVAYSGFSSDRYLDPVSSFEPNHTSGSGNDYFGKINIIASSKLDINVLGYLGATKYDIPNDSAKSTQDQKADLSSYLFGARANYSISKSSVLSILGYTRRQKSDVTSSGIDRVTDSSSRAKALLNEKYFVAAHRTNNESGGQLEFSSTTDWLDVPNEFKVGVGGEIYPIHEYFTFAVTNPSIADSTIPGGDDRLARYDLTHGGTPFLVDTSATGKRYSAYVQDQITAGKWTIAGGFRFDMFDLLEKESGISPRVNAVYRASDDLVIRASYNRIFMQAPIENILVSSSAAARELVGAEQGTVPTAVRSEKAHVVELGAAYKLSDLFSVDITGYGKLIDDFVVKVELGNSGVIFPANIKQGIVAGGELELLMREWNHFSGRLSFATTLSKGTVPEDGSTPLAAGLVLGEEGDNYKHPWAGEDMFNTEHNQLLTAAFTIRYDNPAGFFGLIGGRFDSGLPFDLADANGVGLDPEASRVELRRRGYSDEVIDMLSLQSELPGSPDKYVAPHAVFDLSAGVDLEKLGIFQGRITGSILNVLDTKYLYKFESTFGGTHFGAPRMFLLKAELGL